MYNPKPRPRMRPSACLVVKPGVKSWAISSGSMIGSIVAAHIQSGLPLGYFTTGQRVPEDISIASAELLSALLCGEDVN